MHVVAGRGDRALELAALLVPVGAAAAVVSIIVFRDQTLMTIIDAARVRWKTLCWELGCDRTTAWRRWQLALTKIAARLNA